MNNFIISFKEFLNKLLNKQKQVKLEPIASAPPIPNIPKPEIIISKSFNIYKQFLPNSCYGTRPKDIVIDTGVIHFISAKYVSPNDPYNIDTIINILTTNKVSADYLVERNNGSVRRIFQLVPEDKKSFHAGKSIMLNPDNRQNVNNFSRGIELIGMYEEEFTDYQYEAINWLQDKILKLPLWVGHSEISGSRAVEMKIREDKKIDPGPKFKWNRFNANHFIGS